MKNFQNLRVYFSIFYMFLGNSFNRLVVKCTQWFYMQVQIFSFYFMWIQVLIQLAQARNTLGYIVLPFVRRGKTEQSPPGASEPQPLKLQWHMPQVSLNTHWHMCLSTCMVAPPQHELSCLPLPLPLACTFLFIFSLNSFWSNFRFAFCAGIIKLLLIFYQFFHIHIRR